MIELIPAPFASFHFIVPSNLIRHLLLRHDSFLQKRYLRVVDSNRLHSFFVLNGRGFQAALSPLISAAGLDHLIADLRSQLLG
jgi:hypothetical protein